MQLRLALAALPVILSPLLWLASIPNAKAHEFWLEPYAFQVEAGASIIGNAKTGQNFKGYRHLYLPERFARFELHAPDGMRPVDGIVGDVPILNAQTFTEGLHVVVYQSTGQTVDFDDWSVFTGYLEDEGLPSILARHQERGLDPDKFTEGFVRCAKALVAVGHAKGSDRAFGLPLELVISDNPFQTDRPAVRLLWQGEPLPDRQIKVFYKADAESTAMRRDVTTNAAGEALLPNLGPGQYLLNAVHMIEDTDPPWLSYWASTTFGRP